MRKKVITIGKERCIRLAMTTNNVSREDAEKYTDGELKEVAKLVAQGSKMFSFNFNF